mgnify:CR=1 FL=1
MFMLVFEKRKRAFFSYRRGGDDKEKAGAGIHDRHLCSGCNKGGRWMLLTGEKVRETEVILPNGETARFPIEGIKIEEGAVSCGVEAPAPLLSSSINWGLRSWEMPFRPREAARAFSSGSFIADSDAVVSAEVSLLTK